MALQRIATQATQEVTPTITPIPPTAIIAITPTEIPTLPEIAGAITLGVQAATVRLDPEALVAAVAAVEAQAEVAVDNINLDVNRHEKDMFICSYFGGAIHS